MNGNGFTYMAVLVLMVVAGIALTSASTCWRTIVKREKEAELLFRGNQIRAAIKSYYSNPPQGQRKAYPKHLTDLLKDPRYSGIRRHLRKIYKDPMTREGLWGLIYDSKKSIKGVSSQSRQVPLKTSNFSDENKSFENAATYSAWQFVYLPDKN